MSADYNENEVGPFEDKKIPKKTLMHFPGIDLVEQTEQKFRRIRDCLKTTQ